MGKKQQILKTQTKLEPDHDDPSWPEAPKNRAQTFSSSLKIYLFPARGKREKKFRSVKNVSGRLIIFVSMSVMRENFSEKKIRNKIFFFSFLTGADFLSFSDIFKKFEI